MGSCSGTKHGFRGFGVFLSHTDRHRHVSFPSAYHPHVGKNLQLLQISPFRRLQKRVPRLSQASVLLMGQQKYHLFSPSKDSSRRPNSKSVKLSKIFPHYLIGWNIFCVLLNSDVTMNGPLYLSTTAGCCPVFVFTPHKIHGRQGFMNKTSALLRELFKDINNIPVCKV